MDNVTSVLASINKSIDSTVSAFEKMDGSTGASFAGAGASIAQTKSRLEGLTQAMENTAEPIKKQSALWDGIKGKISAAVGAYAGFQGLKSAISLSDTITQNTARLDMMNDGLQSTEELSNMIYESAQRSRGSYLDTADAVAKLGTMAGDAFSNNKEIIAFSEQLNKHFTLAGTSIEGQQAAMLQLTQAMGSGVLRGEELNSVLEQAPNIVETIAKYMNKPKGAIKELAAEGQITAKIVKEAMLDSADKTDKKFASMPKTFGQTWQEIKSAAAKEFEGISGQLSEILNGAQVKEFVSGIIAALPKAFSALSTFLGYIRKIGSFIVDNWSAIAPILAGIVSGFMAFKAVTIAGKAIDRVKRSFVAFKAVTTAGSAIDGIKHSFVALKGALSLGSLGIAVVAITAIAGAVIYLWNNCEGFRNGVIKIWNTVKAAFIGAWNAIKNFAINIVIGIKNKVVNGFQNMVEGIKQRVSKIKETVVKGFYGAIEFIKSLPGKAIGWGRDFIDGLKKGIKEKISAIGDAVKGVADKIRALLHFSRPDTGPLREYEKWMPDFMKGLSAGISQNKSLVVNQVKDLASRMQAVKLGAMYNMNGGVSIIRPLPVGAVNTAQSKTATTSNQSTKNVYLNVTIEKEADGDRFMRKLKEILEEGAYAGAEGV